MPVANALPVDRSVLLQHLDYTAWATGRILEASAAVAEADLQRDLAASHGSLIETLRHIYYADRIWLSRLQGDGRDFRDAGPGPSLADLQREWPDLLTRFRSLVESLPAETLAADLDYRNLKGEPYRAARWKILLHVVNHGTLHRGQAAAMLRQLGHPAPATDLIFFYLKP